MVLILIVVLEGVSVKLTLPLRFNYEFSRVYKRGQFVPGRFVVVHCFKRPRHLKHNLTIISPDINRVGFTVSRKLKGAVRRNRAKRLLRESFRKIEPDLPEGYDLVIMMKNHERMPSFDQVDHDLKKIFRKLGLLQVLNNA